ncbi:MAG TPA: hypothetical protein VFU59_03825, partial [Candidatus Eisenbacteria bacterium]|nr:hypothetical protein [Candidatus Eisenbacteria bacterium]
MTLGPAAGKGSIGAAVALLPSLVSLLSLVAAAPLASAQPPIGAPPAWVARREAWLDARETRRLARWNESSAALAAADLRAAAAESLYRASLRAWTPDAAAIRIPLAHLRGAALDLLEEGAIERASLLLEGALRDDEPLLPIRAALLGRSGRAEQGLALLAWPPDRRLARGDRWLAGFGSPSSGPARDAAHLLTASALADSLGQARASRSALWALLVSPDAGPSGRDEARRLLARRFLADGTPRLAVDILSDPSTGEQALLLGQAFAQARDTTGAVEALTRFGTRSGVALSERYPALRRAADFAKGRADSLGERSHLDLCRALGDAGEADRGLALLAARRRPASDSAATALRLDVEASLYARARRFSDAMASYRALAARSTAPAARARAALGFARAARGAKIFGAMDSAFLSAAVLDPAGPTGEQAAWERAREWEDQRSAPETAPVFTWANGYLRSGALKSAGRVHGALAWRRAGSPDSARALLAGAPSDDAPGVYWRARLALAAGDSAAARTGFRGVSRQSPTTYEGIRAGDELRAMGAAEDLPQLATTPVRVARAARNEDLDTAAVENRVLAALGWDAISTERVKRVAREGDPARALAATNALEESGVFRVG